MANFSEILRKPSFLIKFLEVILAILCVALHQDSTRSLNYNTNTGIPDQFNLLNDKNKVALVNMVYCGFLLITAMNIIGQLLGGIPKKLGTLWAIVGCTLWVAAGAVILKAYTDVINIKAIKLSPEQEKQLNEELAAGIIGVINGVVYLAEFGLIAKFETEESD